MILHVPLNLEKALHRKAMLAIVAVFDAAGAPAPTSGSAREFPAGASSLSNTRAEVAAAWPLSPVAETGGASAPSLHSGPAGPEVRREPDMRPAQGVILPELAEPSGSAPFPAVVGAPVAYTHPTPRSLAEGAPSTAEVGPEPEAPIPGATPDTDPETPSEPEASTPQGADAPGITDGGSAPAGAEVVGVQPRGRAVSPASVLEEAEGASAPEVAAGGSPAQKRASHSGCSAAEAEAGRNDGDVTEPDRAAAALGISRDDVLARWWELLPVKGLREQGALLARLRKRVPVAAE